MNGIHLIHILLKRILSPFFVLTFLFMCAWLTACGGTSTADQAQVKSPESSEISTSTNSQNNAPVVEAVREDETLSEVVDRLLTTVFPDFKEGKMDPFGTIPKFKTARSAIWKRMQRTKPIAIKKTNQAFPRFFLKAYRFPDKKELAKMVTEWLNGHESSQDNISIGDAVEAFKSPPLLCAISGNDFFIVQTGCVYESPEWDASKKAFFEFFDGEEAEYSWEVTCQAGKTIYVRGRN